MAFDSIDSGGTKIRNFNLYDEVLGNSFSTEIEKNREKWSSGFLFLVIGRNKKVRDRVEKLSRNKKAGYFWD